MKFLEKIVHAQRKHFREGGKLARFYYAFEALETFLFVPEHTTPRSGSVHIRDGMDMKRMMVTVILSMVPCLIFGIWNVGHQSYLATGVEGISCATKMWIGLQVVLPMIAVAYASGLGVEFIFAIFRRHPVNEGFLVSGMLIPLVMPPTIPLWQVSLATIFAVLVGKEVFGGTGMNIFNVALLARAFLYFAYPSEISGDSVWTYIGEGAVVDGYSGATPLAVAASTVGNQEAVPVLDLYEGVWKTGLYDIGNLFLGLIPGSVGETSTLMCLIGALILIGTGIGSWKIILSVFAGSYVMGLIFNLIGLNEFMLLPPHYHWVIGGLAFGAVFMATDPVTASHTELGKWIYGFCIGLLTVLIRVFNPAYPEGIMLAILLMNVFSSLIDHFVISSHKKRRLKRVPAVS
ncbi:MAG: NADH:ubiquinone reductase (Na(+)-transporting) subunit B [Cytophagales bacterium]|nr:NADH:ubiquinone reductase (Na(+)-transporting) subunit B [Cytophagales bacterium]